MPAEMLQTISSYETTPSRLRVIELENGNTLRMEAKDPYGFIYFSLEHGQLPEHLKGAAFTDWHQAELAAQKYQDSRKLALAEIAIAPVKKK